MFFQRQTITSDSVIPALLQLQLDANTCRLMCWFCNEKKLKVQDVNYGVSMFRFSESNSSILIFESNSYTRSKE